MSMSDNECKTRERLMFIHVCRCLSAEYLAYCRTRQPLYAQEPLVVSLIAECCFIPTPTADSSLLLRLGLQMIKGEVRVKQSRT